MSYVLAIFTTVAVGVVVPVCAISFGSWLFGDDGSRKQTMFVAPVVLVCLNAPAYSAAATGFFAWDQAAVMHAFAVTLLGLYMLLTGGTASEGYVLTLIILTLIVSILAVRQTSQIKPTLPQPPATQSNTAGARSDRSVA